MVLSSSSFRKSVKAAGRFFPSLLDFAQPRVQHRFIDVAEWRRSPRSASWHSGDMRPALPANADAGHTHTIAGGARGARIERQPYGPDPNRNVCDSFISPSVYAKLLPGLKHPSLDRREFRYARQPARSRRPASPRTPKPSLRFRNRARHFDSRRRERSHHLRQVRVSENVGDRVR